MKLNDLMKRIKEISRRGFKEPETITTDDLDIIHQCLDHSDHSIVARAYWAIGQIGIKKPDIVSEYIGRAFEDLHHENAKVRENAVFSIGRTGRSKLSFVYNRIDEIMQLSNDAIPKVRFSMIWACENIANADAGLFEQYIPIFETLLYDEDDHYVRAEAPEIFRVIGKYRPELVEQSLPLLKAKLRDTCYVTRIHSEGAIKIIERGLKKEIKN